MLWLYLALIAYLLNAVVFMIDRFLLLVPIPNPVSYAFYTAVPACLVLLLLPFGIKLPLFFNFLVGIGAGLSFFAALTFLYKAERKIDVIEVMPTVSAIAALTTLFLSFIFLSASLTGQELFALFLLLFGAFLMSCFHFKERAGVFMLIAGFFFGLSLVLLKHFFSSADFINGLFWMGTGVAGGAFSFLLLPSARRQIAESFGSTLPGSKFLFVLAKILAGLAALILYYAVKIGNVIFISALQGLQFVFLLLIGIFLMRKIPLLFERHVREKIARKIAATIFIFIGFFLLVI